MNREFRRSPDRIPFPCHKSDAAVVNDRSSEAEIFQGCPICGKRYLIDFQTGRMRKTELNRSAESDRRLLNTIYLILERGSTVELRRKKDGIVSVSEITIKNISTVG